MRMGVAREGRIKPAFQSQNESKSGGRKRFRETPGHPRLL